MNPRKLFVAGSTGAVGRTLVRLADARGVPVVPHARPGSRHESAPDPRAAVVDLADRVATVRAMQGCTTAVQLIGTRRSRFARGDTYESSDIGTTRQLCEAAREAGLDHVVLLSSVGAGRPVGAYLAAKARAETLVRESGLAWTIVRPSSFVGEGHRAPPGMGLFTRLLRLEALRPIRVEELAAAILWAATERAALGQVLEGASLWDAVRRS